MCDGVEVRRVRAWPRHRDYYFAPGLWREMARDRWDVVHVQSYHTFVAPLAMARARTLRIPYVITFHGGGHSSFVRRHLRPVQRRALAPLVRHAARAVAVARFEVPFYEREFGLPGDRFVLCPNGADRIAAGTRPGNGARPVVATVGRLERYKGHHRVVEAFAHVARGRPDARLWIVGTGPEEDALRREASRLGVGDKVEVRGVASSDRSGMMALLAQVSLVVCLSDFETHPVALLEAAAAGCRLVVSNATGLRELAQDGLAECVPATSPPEVIADTIVSALDAGPVDHRPLIPTWDDCAARLLGVYREVACAS
jgi:glycosyltransferase involved in cell wall biosynthesis